MLLLLLLLLRGCLLLAHVISLAAGLVALGLRVAYPVAKATLGIEVRARRLLVLDGAAGVALRRGLTRAAKVAALSAVGAEALVHVQASG